MSLGLVPTQISCAFFSRGFLRQVFSGRRSNHDVCYWLLSSRYVLLSRAVTTISVKAMVLYAGAWFLHYCTPVLGRNMQNKPDGSMYWLSVV